MGLKEWISHNWFTLVQTGVLAAGLLSTGAGLLLEARARRVGNMIQLTQQHRDLWERMYSDPELARILDPGADVANTGMTPQEELFVVFIILHLSTAYYAMRSGFFQKPRGLQKDIKNFFSLPIPHAVWEKVRGLQDPPFAKFVDQYHRSSGELVDA